MVGLDLRGAAAAVGAWLVDDILLVRDNGEGDDDLDMETGLLDGPDPETIYEGVGAVQPITQESRVADPDVARLYEESGARYRALFALDAEGPEEALAGDVLTVPAVHGPSSDPKLVGRTWEVVDKPTATSFAVLRILYLKPV